MEGSVAASDLARDMKAFYTAQLEKFQNEIVQLRKHIEDALAKDEAACNKDLTGRLSAATTLMQTIQEFILTLKWALKRAEAP